MLANLPMFGGGGSGRRYITAHIIQPVHSGAENPSSAFHLKDWQTVLRLVIVWSKAKLQLIPTDSSELISIDHFQKMDRTRWSKPAWVINKQTNNDMNIGHSIGRNLEKSAQIPQSGDDRDRVMFWGKLKISHLFFFLFFLRWGSD